MGPSIPHATAEPPKVGDDSQRDGDEKAILGAPQDALSSEDEVVELVRGYPDGKVERRELACR